MLKPYIQHQDYRYFRLKVNIDRYSIIHQYHDISWYIYYTFHWPNINRYEHHRNMNHVRHFPIFHTFTWSICSFGRSQLCSQRRVRPEVTQVMAGTSSTWWEHPPLNTMFWQTSPRFGYWSPFFMSQTCCWKLFDVIEVCPLFHDDFGMMWDDWRSLNIIKNH